MTNVQSIITNGALAPPKTSKASKAKALNNAAAVNLPMTAAQAVEIAATFGGTMAGADGALTRALVAFRTDETVQADMLAAANTHYMMQKLTYDQAEATRVVGLKKYSKNVNLHDDEHRTFEQQRVIDTMRVMWHRANKLAGIVKAKSEKQIAADVNRAAKEAEKKTIESRRDEAWQIVHPAPATGNVDVDTAMTRFVATMTAYHSGNADKFIGDTGSAWRNWLAAAPKAKQ